MVEFLSLPPRKRSRKCFHVHLQQTHNHHCSKEKSEGNCRKRKTNMLAMHSLQRTENEFGVKEGLTISNEAEVLSDIIFADCLSIESGHGGCAVANKDTVPVAIMLAGSSILLEDRLLTYHPQLYASVTVPSKHWSVLTPANSNVFLPLSRSHLFIGKSGFHMPLIRALSKRTSSEVMTFLRGS